jgi:predicted metal-dependent hydrolase
VSDVFTITISPDISINCSVIYKSVKRLSLKISATTGLHCVCPHRTPNHIINEFIHNQHSWVKKHLTTIRLSEDYKLNHSSLPDKIALPCLDQTWQVKYIDAHRNPRYQCKNGTLILYSNGKLGQIKTLLTSWLREHARIYYEQTTPTLAKRASLDYQRLSVGYAQTRWGTCDSHNHIRLNMLLMFLPKIYIQHVILHELCHTVHRNHSKAFWDLLEKHDPQTPRHKKDLRNQSWAYQFIPSIFWQ